MVLLVILRLPQLLGITNPSYTGFMPLLDWRITEEERKLSR